MGAYLFHRAIHQLLFVLLHPLHYATVNGILWHPPIYLQQAWPGHVCTRACITQAMYLQVQLLVQAVPGWVGKLSYGWKKNINRIQ